MIISLCPPAMSLKDNSIHSASSNENFFQVPTCGSHKVKYNPESDWDFCLDVADEQVDLSLVLPHYRARTQPVNHRMNMFIGGEHAPVKAKVVCPFVPYPSSVLTAIAVPNLTSRQILPGRPGQNLRHHTVDSLRFQRSHPTHLVAGDLFCGLHQPDLAQCVGQPCLRQRYTLHI